MTAVPNPSAEAHPMAPYVCPSHLTTESRVAFRTDALDALDAAFVAGATVVSLDLSAVVDMDASGLGVLILLQKRARERHMRVRLYHVPGLVERLFDDTRMGPLFDIVRPY